VPHAVSCTFATLFPSRRLQRLGPVRAVRSFCFNCLSVLRLRCVFACPIELPLLWFSKDRPSAVSSASVLSRFPSLRTFSFGPTLPSVRHLPPLPFLPALTVCSVCGPAGLLHPAPGPGVRAVSLPASSCAVFPRFRTPPVAPRARIHTLRSFSLVDSRFASPRCFSLPSLLFRTVSNSNLRDLRALLHLQVRSPMLRFRRRRPDASLGFVPLQGSPFTPSAPMNTPGARPP
jgi:hypothetical protein